VETRIPALPKSKEAYLCADDAGGKTNSFVNTFWAKLDGSVDVSKPTDRWDWCGLYFSDQPKPTYFKQSDFVSNPSAVFGTLDALLNHKLIKPSNLALQNI